jgi:hypothetical protein
MRSMDLTLDDGTQIEVGTAFVEKVTLALDGRKVELTAPEALALAGLLHAAAAQAPRARYR